MGARVWEPDLPGVLDGVAATLASPLQREAGWAVVSWDASGCAVVVRAVGLDPTLRAAVEGRDGGWLADRGRRARGPLRLRGQELAPAPELASALHAPGDRGVALFPLVGETGVAACVVVPVEVEAGLGAAAAAWRGCHRLVAGLQVAAGAGALRVILEEDRRRPLSLCDGVLVVDGGDRVLFADGLARELPGWGGGAGAGRTLHELPGGAVLASVPMSLPGSPVPHSRTLPGSGTEPVVLTVTVVPTRILDGRLDGSRVFLLAGGDGGPTVDRTTRILSMGLRVADAADELLRWCDDLDGGGGDGPGAFASACARAARTAFDLVRAVVEGTGGEGARGEVDLNECMRQVVGHLREQAECEGVRVFSFLRPELPPVPGDAVAVLRALHTLVWGARDSLGEGGGTLTVRTWTEDRWVFAAVSDDGSGATRPPSTSTALVPAEPDGGARRREELDAIRSFAERCGGRLEVERRPRVWNRATLMLPVERRSAAPTRPQPARRDGGVSPLEVLVVDDNEALRSVLRRFLERRGHSVTEAVDGEDALGIVAARSFDRAIVDIHMPRKDGREFYASLASVAPALREQTFFTTGGAMEESVERFLQESGRPALAKPFDFQELARRLEGAA